MSNAVADIIKNTIIANSMLIANDKIIVGVSGGADSMCLLHFLLSIKQEYNLELIVAHINHNLRGEEALRDQNMVENYCKKMNVPCKVHNADINTISFETGEGCEECGRRVRYEFFNQLCGNNGKIATAHTLSDTCETTLFNIARGTGLKGLCGIPKVRGNIIRPIIDITRQQVEEYCRENNIEYVTDSTNSENEYSRNKIRNIVIPVLKDINPSFENSVTRLTQIVSQQLTVVTNLADELLKKSKVKNGYNCTELLTADFVIIKQAIINLFRDIGCHTYEEKHLELIINLIKNKQGVVQLPKGYAVSTKQGILRIYSKKTFNNENIVNAEISSDDFNSLIEEGISFPSENQTFIINNQKIEIIFFAKQEFDKIAKVHNLLVKNALDYDIITGKSLFRTRQPRDVFKQRSRGVTKTLKKLFIESKIPQEQRDKIPVLANDNTVFWVSGFGVSQECAVTDKTETVALITVENILS